MNCNNLKPIKHSLNPKKKNNPPRPKTGIFHRAKPYMEKPIPEPLEGQGIGRQEHEGNFSVFGPNRGGSIENLSDNSTRSNLFVRVFPCWGGREPIGDDSLTASRREYVASGAALEWVDISTNQEDADHRDQHNDPQRPLHRRPVAGPRQDLHVSHSQTPQLS